MNFQWRFRLEQSESRCKNRVKFITGNRATDYEQMIN